MTVHLPALRAMPLPPTASKVDVDLAIAASMEQDGQLENALSVANCVLDDHPDNPLALLICGRICVKMQKYGLAYNILKRSLSFRDRYDTRNNLAAACVGMLQLDEAKRLSQEARRQKPHDERALALLCLIAVYECNPRLAIDLGEKALAIKPDMADVHESKGYAHLMVGEWEPGWAGYEKFIGASKYRPIKPPYENCPYWDGREGIDFYMRGEQGIGDEISFSSIVPEVVPQMKSLVFDCDEKLGGLFARSFPGVEIHSTRKAKKDEKDWLNGRKFDAHALVGTLAYHRRKSLADFPGTPYLVADPERRIQWRALLDTLPGKKVGLAWTGGYRNTFRERRSLSLETLLPILRVPDVSWVSLQYQDAADDIREFHGKHGIKIQHWPRASESQDYDDTAALVAELDLVISVCTAVVHLAGGLGKKCWVLVPSKPRWFYQLNGDRSPWYGSVELFRQSEEWPLHEVARRLAEFAHA